MQILFQILSTSYDNTVRVWSLNDQPYEKGKKGKRKQAKPSNEEMNTEPLYSITHNNQTGRWLTPFQVLSGRYLLFSFSLVDNTSLLARLPGIRIAKKYSLWGI